MVDHLDNAGRQELRGLVRRQNRVERTNNLTSAALGQGDLRVHSGGKVTIQNGGFSVTGTADVIGSLIGSGVLNWTGPWTLTGAGLISGNVTISGNTTQSGSVTQTGSLTVSGGGRIYVGNITLDPAGSGGQITSSGFLRLVAATGFQFQGNGTLTGNLGVTGSFSAASKTFKIPHPFIEDAWLIHGSTEAPVHGVEYWGDQELDASGEALVELPDYFEWLTQAEGRAVLVTGRGFVADWTDIEDGFFTVTGEPKGRFSWLVKAARSDVVFDPITPMSEAERDARSVSDD